MEKRSRGHWGIFGLTALALVGLMGIVPTAPLPLQEAITSDDTLLLLLPIAPPPKADSIWLAMLECSGAEVQKGGDFEDVKWFVGDVQLYDKFHSIIGIWQPPDTIVLDIWHAGEAWLIGHELLHHLLRGPPGDVKHPTNPFWFPCQVMPFQVGGIGIMGGSHPPMMKNLTDYPK